MNTEFLCHQVFTMHFIEDMRPISLFSQNLIKLTLCCKTDPEHTPSRINIYESIISPCGNKKVEILFMLVSNH